MHSTSFASSQDQSNDSMNTSLQRSGLAMSVGDTKSIVLALQSLQEKIRKLEHDRNFHQEQCEKSQRAHEAFKLEIESQLDGERRQHRHREQELHDLLASANAERSRLQATLEESKKDLGTFRNELEVLLDVERKQAKEREDQLSQELEELKEERENERRKLEKLQQTIEQLRSEREIVQQTNQRLESTVRDLIAMNNNLMDSVGAKPPFKAGVRKHQHADVQNISASTSKRPSSANRRGLSYRNPTHSSMSRDVRQSEFPMRHPTPTHRPRSPVIRQQTKRASGSANTSLHGVPKDQIQAIDEVYRELQNEHRDLHNKYQETIRQAAANGTPPEILTAQLNHIMGLIDRKAEQIRLMRVTQGEINAAALSDGHDAPTREAPLAKGTEKTLQRGQIVNELRALFARNKMS